MAVGGGRRAYLCTRHSYSRPSFASRRKPNVLVCARLCQVRTKVLIRAEYGKSIFGFPVGRGAVLVRDELHRSVGKRRERKVS